MADLSDKTHLTSVSTTEANFQDEIGRVWDVLNQLMSAGAPYTADLVSHSVTPTKAHMILDTETHAATDTLNNIVASSINQKTILVHIASSARAITLKHALGGSGQLKLRDAVDLTMSNVNQMICFYYDLATTSWIEVWRNWGLYLPDATSLAAAKTALGLATAAFQATGTSGANVPLMSTANTWSASQIISAVSTNTQWKASRTTTGLSDAYLQANNGAAAVGTSQNINFNFNTNDTTRGYVAGDGGFVVGTPTGASKGAGTINIQGGIYKNGIALGANIVPNNSATAHTFAAADNSTLWNATGAADQTWPLTAAATLGTGWFAYFVNNTTHTITLDPNAAETIDGLATIACYPEEMRLIICDGTAFTSTVLRPFKLKLTSSQNFIIPPGYPSLYLTGHGSGASGSNSSSTQAFAAGGSGGGYNEELLLVSEIGGVGATISVTIAAGGVGKTNSGVFQDGNPGSNTTFGTFFTAYGAGKSVANSSGGASGGPGSSGAAGGAASGAAGGTGGSSKLFGRIGFTLNAAPAGFGTNATNATDTSDFFAGAPGGSRATTTSNRGGNSVNGGAGGGGPATTGVPSGGTASGNGGNGGAGGNTASPNGGNGVAPGGGGGASGISANGAATAGSGADGDLTIRGRISA